MTVTNATDRYACANFIVAPTIAEGANFTTITAALAAASSGDTIFIKPGTYTEDITLKAGVTLTSFSGDAEQSNVVIQGKCSFSAAGTTTISNIRLQTNGDYALAVTGSSASAVNLKNCFIDATDNTAISFTSSSSSAFIDMKYCNGDIGTTGIAIFEHSSAGYISMLFCGLNNSGGSTTANTITGTGSISPNHTDFASALSFSSSSTMLGAHLTFNTPGQIAITTSGTSIANIQFTKLFTSTSSAVSIGAGTRIEMHQTFISSSNATTIDGTGELYYTDLTFNSVATIAAGITQTLTNMKTFISAGGSGSSGEVLTSNGATTPPSWQAASGGGITLDTPQATTSGTAFDFTGIPSGTKKITVIFQGISLNGVNAIQLRLGDSGGIDATGYNGFTTDSIATSTAWGDAILITPVSSSSQTYSGTCELNLINSSTNTWVVNVFLSSTAVSARMLGNGYKSLSGELTQLRVTRSVTNTFDAGQVNISYQ